MSRYKTIADVAFSWGCTKRQMTKEKMLEVINNLAEIIDSRVSTIKILRAEIEGLQILKELIRNESAALRSAGQALDASAHIVTAMSRKI